MTTSVLYVATLIIVGLLVLFLVVYLLLIIIALRRAGNHLKKLAETLQKIVDDTSLLGGNLATINGALTKLLSGLSAVDNHLVAVAKVFKLV